MVLVEDLASALQIEIVLAERRPGQRRQRLEVGADDRGLGALGVTALEASSLLVELLERFRPHLLLFGDPAVLAHFLGDVAVVAELLLDRLELLAQVVLALAAVHLAARLKRDLLLHGQELDLSSQKPMDSPQASERIEGREDLLRLAPWQVEIAGCEIREPPGLFEVGGEDHDLRGDLLAEVDDALEVLLDGSHHGLELERLVLRLVLFDRPDLGLKERASSG